MNPWQHLILALILFAAGLYVFLPIILRGP